MQACYFGLRPMVTYRAIDLGATTGQIGLLAGAFGGVSLLVAIPIGRLLDRIGAGRGTVYGILIEVFGAFIGLFAVNFQILFLAATIMGLGHVTAMPGHSMYIAINWPTEKLTSMYNNYATAVSVGQAIGSPAAIFAGTMFVAHATSGSTVNSVAGLTVALLFGLMALPAAWMLREAKGAHALKHPPRNRLERKADGAARKQAGQTKGTWAIMLTSAIVVAAQDVLITFLPVWAVSKSVSANTVAVLLASRAIFTLFIRLFSTRLVAQFGRKAVLISSIVSGCLGFVLLPFVGGSLSFISMFFLGIGLGIAQPITLVMLMDQVDPSSRGAALGLRMFGHRLGQLALPLAMGGVANLGGLNLAWWSTSAVMSSGILLTLLDRTPDKKY